MNRILLLALTVLCHSASAFDFSAYPPQDIDKYIDIERPKFKETGGVEIMMPSKKVSFDAIVDRPPQKCDTAYFLRIMKAAGYKPEAIPPINTCLKLRSAGGKTVPAYVQDAIGDSIAKELNVNNKAHFYAMYIYFDNKYKVPFFLVNDFEAVSNGTQP